MSDNKICLGAIVGVHGIRGEVKVKSFSDDEKNLTRYGDVTNEAGDKKFSLKIVGHSKELLRVKIKGVDDRNTAETLVGTAFYVNRDLLPDLKDDEFYQNIRKIYKVFSLSNPLFPARTTCLLYGKIFLWDKPTVSMK